MAAVSQRNHLELNFPINSDYFWLMIYYTFSTVHWECSICKNGKERPFLNQNNFVTALNLISHTAENSNIQNALFLKQRAQPSWKFAKRYIFSLSYLVISKV